MAKKEATDFDMREYDYKFFFVEKMGADGYTLYYSAARQGWDYYFEDATMYTSKEKAEHAAKWNGGWVRIATVTLEI